MPVVLGIIDVESHKPIHNHRIPFCRGRTPIRLDLLAVLFASGTTSAEIRINLRQAKIHSHVNSSNAITHNHRASFHSPCREKLMIRSLQIHTPSSITTRLAKKPTQLRPCRNGLPETIFHRLRHRHHLPLRLRRHPLRQPQEVSDRHRRLLAISVLACAAVADEPGDDGACVLLVADVDVEEGGGDGCLGWSGMRRVDQHVGLFVDGACLFGFSVVRGVCVYVRVSLNLSTSRYAISSEPGVKDFWTRAMLRQDCPSP